MISKLAPDRRIPAQLPPRVRAFTNRHAEFSVLRQWDTENDGPFVAVLDGQGGVGKTSIAVRWLQDARDRFVDGQLYADLGANTPNGPVSPDQVLEWFLLALGAHPRTIPLDLGQRQALFRSLTADRAIAVLLDNAFSTAQVRPLLPASAVSTVVVTSRRRLAGLNLHGACFLTVDPLSISDSVDLLSTVVGSGRLADGADELARLCGGLPIALSVVAARLAAHPQRSATREIKALRQYNRLANLTLDGSSVKAVFDVGYDQLSDTQKRVYRLCALHPSQEFGVEVAAAAVGEPLKDVDRVLCDLVELNLITQVDDLRFRFHDLQYLDARERSERTESKEEHDAAIRRIAEWYLDRVVDAEMLLRGSRRHIGPRFDNAHEGEFASHRVALEWLDGERHNIVLAVKAGAGSGWDDLTWQFCEALWGYFLHIRNFHDFQEIHVLGISAAQRVGNVLAESCLRAQWCFALCGASRFDEAIVEGRASVALAEAAQDEPARAVALGELARAVQGAGDLDGALTYLSQVKAIRDVIGTDRASALTQRSIGEVYAKQRRYDDAINAILDSADTLRPLDRVQYANVLTSLATVYLQCGRAEDAEPILTEALEITQEFGSQHYQAQVLEVQGDVAEQRGDVENARHHWTAAREIYNANGDPEAARVTERLDQLPPLISEA